MCSSLLGRSARWLLSLSLLASNAPSAAAQSAPQPVPALDKAVVQPPSGRALGSALVGGIPVNLFTGTASPSIPLCALAGRSLNVPISLNYGAGNGVQVASVASEVGTGWQLSAGGSISCEVKGRPDELDTETKDWLRPLYYLSTISSGQLQKLQQQFCQGKDTEYDVYHLTAPGLQADFVVSGPYGTYQATADVHVLNDQTLTVEPHFGGYGRNYTRQITSFTVWDASGTQYTFDQKQNTRIQTQTKSLSSSNWSSKDDYTYISQWQLTRIRSTTGDEISFIYQAYSGSPVTYKSYSHVVLAYQKCDIWDQNCQGGTAGSNYNTRYESTTTVTSSTTYRVASVTSATGTVRFYRDQYSRRDAPGEKALDKVAVFDRENNLLQSVLLSYSYFGPGTNTSPDEVRLRLDRVTTKSSGCQATSVELKYREYGPTVSRATFRRDAWGYFNDNTSTELLCFVDSRYPSGDRSPSAGNTAQNCLLYRMQYGTGAYTELTYGRHIDGAGATIGGVRLEQVRVHNGENAALDQVVSLNYNTFISGSATPAATSSAPIVKTPLLYEWQNVRYSYGAYNDVCNSNDDQISKYLYRNSDPIEALPADYIHYQWVTIQYPNRSRAAYLFTTVNDYPDTYNTLSVKLSTDPYNTSSGCYINDGSLPTETMGSCSGDPLSPKRAGFYRNLPQDQRPYGVLNSAAARRGLVLRQVEADAEGRLISQVDNQYTPQPADSAPIRSVVVARERQAFNYNYYSYYYNAKVYQHERIWTPLTRQTTLRYDQRRGNTGSIAAQTSITEYEYEYGMVRKVKAYDPAGGDAQVVEYYHAKTDFAYLPQVLVNARDNVSLVKTEAYRQDAAGTKKGSIWTYYDYQPNPNNYVRPVRTGVWDVSAGNQTQYQTQAVEFDDYSNVVNVQSTSGLWSGTAWGYKQLLPIATVANGKFTTPASGGIATAGHTSFEEDYDPNWNTGTTYTGEAKTGRRSVRLSTPNGVYGPGKLFTIEPANQRGKYVFSCWAKVPRGEGGQSTVTLVTYISPPSGSNSWRGTSTTVSSGQDWQLCRTVLDLDEPAIRATLSAGQNITIQCYPWISSGSGNVLVDEVRFHPEAARMTTATYQLLVGRTSATDENNVTTYYEYDAENQPLLVRDDKGNILQRTKISSTATTQETITGVAQTGGSSYPNTSVTFTADASGCASNLTYSWNFGDGATAKGAGVQAHTYAQSGTYPLTVVAEAPGFNPVEKTLAVQVVAALNVYATYGGRNYVDLCRTNDTGRDVRITLQPQQGCVGYTYRWEASEYTASNGSWGPWTDSNNSTDTFNYYHDVPRKLQVRCTVTDVCGNSLVYSDRFETSKSDPNCNNIAQ